MLHSDAANSQTEDGLRKGKCYSSTNLDYLIEIVEFNRFFTSIYLYSNLYSAPSR